MSLKKRVSDLETKITDTAKFLHTEINKTNSRIDSLEEREFTPDLNSFDLLEQDMKLAEFIKKLKALDNKHPSWEKFKLDSLLGQAKKNPDFWWGVDSGKDGSDYKAAEEIKQELQKADLDRQAEIARVSLEYMERIGALNVTLQARAESAKNQSAEIHKLKSSNASLEYKNKKLKRENTDHNKTIEILLSEIEGLKSVNENYRENYDDLVKEKEEDELIKASSIIFSEKYDKAEEELCSAKETIKFLRSEISETEKKAVTSFNMYKACEISLQEFKNENRKLEEEIEALNTSIRTKRPNSVQAKANQKAEAKIRELQSEIDRLKIVNECCGGHYNDLVEKNRELKKSLEVAKNENKEIKEFYARYGIKI